eukprot:scaffold14840_cov101-Isochrysis_galbana.AAC.6
MGRDAALETLMVRRALKAVKRSDVCLLVIDATDGVSDQPGPSSTHGVACRPLYFGASPYSHPRPLEFRLARCLTPLPPPSQESRLAEYVTETGRACVVAVNKWDAVSAKDDRKFRCEWE